MKSIGDERARGIANLLQLISKVGAVDVLDEQSTAEVGKLVKEHKINPDTFSLLVLVVQSMSEPSEFHPSKAPRRRVTHPGSTGCC